MVVVAELFEGDGFAVKVDAFVGRVTRIIRCEVVDVEDAFLLRVSLIKPRRGCRQ